MNMWVQAAVPISDLITFMSGNIPFDKLLPMKINCQINDQDSTCTFSGSAAQRLKNAYNIYLYVCAALRLQGHVL
jgi:hypothetical protein